jgi:hypothetical protein
MKFSTRLKKLGICVSKAKSYNLYENFETYLFEDFRVALIIEEGYLKISLMSSSERTWYEISRKKNYSVKRLKIKPIICERE